MPYFARRQGSQSVCLHLTLHLAFYFYASIFINYILQLADLAPFSAATATVTLKVFPRGTAMQSPTGVGATNVSGGSQVLEARF